MASIKATPVAISIPFDNSQNDFTATNVQAAIEEIGASASPGFTWARSGGLLASSWLFNDGILSNLTGRLVPLTDASIARIFVSNQNVSTYQVTIFSHDGDSINLTSLTTVTVTNSRGGSVAVNIPVETNKQLAVRLTSGSAANIIVGLILKGGGV